MGERKTRGAILAVTAAAVFFLVIGLTLASLSLADLSFASSYASATSDEWLARAAVAQFLSDDAKLRQRAFRPPPASSAAVNWLQRYRDQPVFPDGSNFANHVSITFESDQPYFSVDNTLGTGPVSGWLDHGRTSRSVPAYCVSLIIRTEAHLYEALLQARWPYLLVSPPPIALAGGDEGGSPLKAQGAVLLLERPVDESAEAPRTLPAPTGRALNLYRRATMGDFKIRLGIPAPFESGGNLLVGRVDSQNGEKVEVAPATPANLWEGVARSGRERVNLRKRITSLLAVGAPEGLPNSFPAEAIEYLEDQAVYRLKNSVGLTGSAYLDGSLVCDDPNVTLRLNDCKLYINGNLNMGPGQIFGDNASLVVNGAVVLDEGGLSAGHKAAVLQCVSLSVNASGTFNGLILVRNSAVFVPRESGNFEIRGAIVVGGSATGEVGRGGCVICSATLEYDPRYLTAANRISDYQLIRFRRLD